MDGAVARRLGQCTRFGAAFDLATDRVVDLICIAAAIAQVGGVSGLIAKVYLIARFGFEPFVLLHIRNLNSLPGPVWWVRLSIAWRKTLSAVVLESVSLGKSRVFWHLFFDPLRGRPYDSTVSMGLELSMAFICAGYMMILHILTGKRKTNANF
ncbi:MAG: unnamed protein product [uncultured Caballeronia sp.]|nr:MAG: unnamed protein product [uncultured Caballeronia sp.]